MLRGMAISAGSSILALPLDVVIAWLAPKTMLWLRIVLFEGRRGLIVERSINRQWRFTRGTATWKAALVAARSEQFAKVRDDS